MSLRYALLGLLADAPASGYELARTFEVSLQHWAWHARHSQIYPELNKLADEGVIDVLEEGARGRRTYAITDAGRAELRQWLINPPEAPTVRNESVLRIFLLPTLDPDDCKVLLREYEREALESGAELDRIVERFGAMPAPHNRLWFGRLAAEYGRRTFAAQLDWSRWALDHLDNLDNLEQTDAPAPTQ